jgi:hypothetical protein
MRTHGLISDIQSDVINSWNSKIFLTFDVDWAHDNVIQDTAEIVEHYGLRGTWFFTHHSSLISKLRGNGHEIGIHPNFNPLLNSTGNGTVNQIISRCLLWSGKVASSRSHSLVFGSPIARELAQNEIKYSSNYSIMASSGMVLKPWQTTSGLIECPYSWADEFSWSDVDQPSITDWSHSDGLLIADFHPIHVFLNSKNSHLYEETRALHQLPDELLEHRTDGSGTRQSLIEVCELLS